MITKKPFHQFGLRPVLAWSGAAALAMSFLFGSSAAIAAPPAANTPIGNQATASFTDPAGIGLVATSNKVETTVQQVGSFTLDGYSTLTTNVVNVKTLTAGSIFYAPHVIANTGNGVDTFTIRVTDDNSRYSRVQVFADADHDGAPDNPSAPLCTGAPCVASGVSIAGMGSFDFVVAYTIAPTATTPLTPYNTSLVTVTPDTVALYAAGNVAASDKDQADLTTGAAFSMTKRIGVPAVLAPGGVAWPLAATGGLPSTSGACATTWSSSVVIPSANCQYTVFTLDIKSTGAAAGRFVMHDVLPAGLTYVAGSAVWSAAGGVALGDDVGGDPVGIDFQVIGGNTINAVIESLAPNASQTISFVVLVPPTATASNTTNVAYYNSKDPGPGPTAPLPGPTPTPTNPVPFVITPGYGIVLGSSSATAVTAVDTVAGVTPNATTADTSTVASLPAGATVAFPQQVFNTGTAADSVNLTVFTSSFPAGTIWRFFAADGATPLLDTNSDGVVDTGPIPAGGKVTVVAKATLLTTVPVGSGPYAAVIRGASVNDPSKVEATRDTLTAVIGSLVDLTNTTSGTGVGSVAGGDLGPGPSPDPTVTATTAAGEGTIIPLYIKNNDTINQTYILGASQTPSFPGSLPAGWTVKFVAAGATCAGPAITTVAVTQGSQQHVDACVTPAPGHPPGTTTPVYFRVISTAASSTGSFVNDVITDAVTVTAPLTYKATLTPDGSGQISPSGSLVFAHTLRNVGSQSCAGPYTIETALSAADIADGWTSVLYLDVNGSTTLDAGDTLITGALPGPLAAGVEQKILVKLFAPGGATANAVKTFTVTSTFPAGATGCGTSTVTDTATVVTGQIRMYKKQAADANCDGVAEGALGTAALSLKPGQCIVYEVLAINEGAAPVTNMMIHDTAPAYTTLSSAQPTVQCVSSGMTGAAVSYLASGNTVTCGSATNTVAPNGGSATLTFAVKINE